jgi:hypothetical protein
MNIWVAIIWIVTLAVIVVVITPLVLYLCWRLVRSARNIDRLFSVTYAAAVGIVENTAHVTALEDTITVAGGMLETAAQLEQHSGAIEGLLLTRLRSGGVR